jgi:hypothetical protein
MRKPCGDALLIRASWQRGWNHPLYLMSAASSSTGIRYGHSPEAPVAMSWGGILCYVLGDYESGIEPAAAACRCKAAPPSPRWRAVCNFSFTIDINCWRLS